MSGTFISYREDDAKGWALLLRNELAKNFGDEHVFLDKDALHAGSWREQLQAALDRCGVVLVVMGRRWLDARDEGGARRIADPNDVHRQEIAIALARKDVLVIPVLVDGCSVPRPEELPGDIRTLVEQQAQSLADRGDYLELDLEQLVADIARATGAPVLPRQPPRRRFPWPGALAAAVVIYISIYIGLEIDYRHWTWIVFLLLIPFLVVSGIALRIGLGPRVRR